MNLNKANDLQVVNYLINTYNVDSLRKICNYLTLATIKTLYPNDTNPKLEDEKELSEKQMFELLQLNVKFLKENAKLNWNILK